MAFCRAELAPVERHGHRFGVRLAPEQTSLGDLVDGVYASLDVEECGAFPGPTSGNNVTPGILEIPYATMQFGKRLL
jgi:hypothetical protein